MTAWGRVLAAVLALLPAGWGLCVGWVSTPDAPQAASAPCPCCLPEAPLDEAPAPGSEPHHDCPGCGFKDAGRGVVPAEAVPDLPDAEAAAFAPAVAASAAAPCDGPEPVEARASGPPLRDRRENVVLRI